MPDAPDTPAGPAYDEVKSRAIHLAEKRHDIGFFYDLFRHTPPANAQSEGGSLGDLSGSLIDGRCRRPRRSAAATWANSSPSSGALRAVPDRARLG